MRTLAITQNITVDGSIEMLGDWFDPQGKEGMDTSDLLDELHRQDRKADGLLVGRRTFEDLRGYWPQLSDDPTGMRLPEPGPEVRRLLDHGRPAVGELDGPVQ